MGHGHILLKVWLWAGVWGLVWAEYMGLARWGKCGRCPVSGGPEISPSIVLHLVLLGTETGPHVVAGAVALERVGSLSMIRECASILRSIIACLLLLITIEKPAVRGPPTMSPMHQKMPASIGHNVLASSVHWSHVAWGSVGRRMDGAPTGLRSLAIAPAPTAIAPMRSGAVILGATMWSNVPLPPLFDAVVS